MKLYGCETNLELKLKEIILEGLTDAELLKLASDIKFKFREDVLQDENIVVDALLQIIEELGRRN